MVQRLLEVARFAPKTRHDAPIAPEIREPKMTPKRTACICSSPISSNARVPMKRLIVNPMPQRAATPKRNPARLLGKTRKPERDQNRARLRNAEQLS